jgi:hypothetical protein
LIRNLTAVGGEFLVAHVAQGSFLGTKASPAVRGMIKMRPGGTYPKLEWYRASCRGIVMPRESMSAKRKSVLKRIRAIELAIGKAKEYLESGAHANWRGFHPLFVHKVKDGKEMPPHKDWVKNFYLPRMYKALGRTEKILERLELQGK